MRYVYSFAAWPDETWGFHRAVHDLFRAMNTRVEMVFVAGASSSTRRTVSLSPATSSDSGRLCHITASPFERWSGRRMLSQNRFFDQSQLRDGLCRVLP